MVIPDFASAVDDATPVKSPTVRSEIRRGLESMMAAATVDLMSEKDSHAPFVHAGGVWESFPDAEFTVAVANTGAKHRQLSERRVKGCTDVT